MKIRSISAYMAQSDKATVRVFLIYLGMTDRLLMETSPTERPTRGLLFLTDAGLKSLLGGESGQSVIMDWEAPLLRNLDVSPRFRSFHRYSQKLQKPRLRVKKL